MMMRRRRSRLIHSLIAAFYAGGIAGWCLHATFAPGSTTAIRAPASRPDPETLPRDAPAATTGESSRKGSVATRARLDAEDDVPVIGADPIAELRRHNLRLPIDGADVDDMKGRFSERRGDGGRRHEAVDILAPRHTPVRAVEAGTIAKLFPSKAGGTTVYQFDPTGRFCYYYAHLQRYAEDLTEGQQVSAGEVLGYVGTSGNAPTGTPHLHFAIFELTPDRRWWEGRPLDPYLACRR